jgi:purine nucleosidase
VTERQTVIIDTDPGKDDAVAILLALASPGELDVRAITVVAGNVPLALTERNARALVALAGRSDIPVHAGYAAPLSHELITAEHIHGESGIDGAGLPDPEQPLAKAHAVDAIIDAIRTAPKRTVTLCTLGPLTNVATALSRAPEIVPRLRAIVMMGGAIGLGNVTPAAEFNVYVDPHAAATVFASGVPVVMVPLDVTHQAIVTPSWAGHMAQLGTRAGLAVGGMYKGPATRSSPRHGGRGVPLHDPCVIAWLLWPELFEGGRYHVAVETESELTRGRTVVDRWNATGAPPNALVLERVDATALFERLTERLRALP